MGKSVLSENKIPKSILELIEKISSVLNENNIEGYLVRGFVRDLLLGRPTKDLDVVVIGSGINAAQLCAKHLGIKNVSVFKRFGTAMFVASEIDVEFVGARKESYTEDSRKPFVEDGTLEDDQNRRDFTINAMDISLSNNNFGKLIDPFDGQNDLQNKTIKTPHEPEITYSDDPLRMMRAIRFATQLGFDIEKNSLQAIKEQRERIKIISEERISDE